MSGGGVLVVVPSLRAGGAERAAVWLPDAFAARGDQGDVVLAVFNGAERAYELAATSRARLVDLKSPPAPRGLARIWCMPRRAALRVVRLARLIRTTNPARLIGFTDSANLPLVLAALLTGRRRRLVVCVHRDPARLPWQHALIARALYPLAGGIAAVSHGAARALERRLGFAPGTVHVVNNPVDLSGIRAAAADGPAPLQGAFLDPAAGPFFLAAGRLVPGKDFAALLAIFARPECANFRLVIAGEGPERARLAAHIETLGLTDRVLLAGHLANPFALMARARALLMTSRHEAFPMTLIEAMACGCPAVAYDCDYGPREALRDGVSGFLVPPGDAAAFAARMVRLAADDGLRESMSRAARADAAAFAADVVAARWLELP